MSLLGKKKKLAMKKRIKQYKPVALLLDIMMQTGLPMKQEGLLAVLILEDGILFMDGDGEEFTVSRSHIKSIRTTRETEHFGQDLQKAQKKIPAVVIEYQEAVKGLQSIVILPTSLETVVMIPEVESFVEEANKLFFRIPPSWVRPKLYEKNVETF